VRFEPLASEEPFDSHGLKPLAQALLCADAAAPYRVAYSSRCYIEAYSDLTRARFLGGLILTLLFVGCSSPTQMLLAARVTRQCDFDAGIKPDFLPETQHIRADSSWKVRPPPKDLLDRYFTTY
jgi:Malate synthase